MWDPDRWLLTVSWVIPLAALILFFAYPLSIVALKSVTLADGRWGWDHYAQVLGAALFGRR